MRGEWGEDEPGGTVTGDLVHYSCELFRTHNAAFGAGPAEEETRLVSSS